MRVVDENRTIIEPSSSLDPEKDILVLSPVVSPNCLREYFAIINDRGYPDRAKRLVDLYGEVSKWDDSPQNKRRFRQFAIDHNARFLRFIEDEDNILLDRNKVDLNSLGRHGSVVRYFFDHNHHLRTMRDLSIDLSCSWSELHSAIFVEEKEREEKEE